MFMMKGNQIMKYLEIKNNKVLFLNKEGKQKPIDEINKDDILYLLEKAFDDEFEYDPYDDSKIQHQVHNIIYKDLCKKIESFISDKQKIEEEINSQYKEAWEKYCK